MPNTTPNLPAAPHQRQRHPNATAPDGQHKHALKMARVSLLLNNPFYGQLAMVMPNVIDPDVETTATDGTSTRWNPAYLETLSKPEVAGIMAHNVMHVAHGHTWRRGGRDVEGWNAACDKVINGLLDKAKFALPTDAIYPAPSDVGKSAEALYRKSPPKNGKGGGNGTPPPGSPPPQQGQGQGQGGGSGNKNKGKQPPGSCGCGKVEDSPSEQQKSLEAKWKQEVTKAAATAKAQGNLPGDLERFAEEITNPKVPWEIILRSFVERTARNDFNWTRPNVRHLGRGIILPTLISDKLPDVVIAVDTSGSISTRELTAFASEISGVLEAFETTIHVVYADSRVAHHHTVSRDELPLKLEPKGGGGTDFRPVFKWVEEQGIEPACTIYLTDLMGNFPDAEPEYPVLWVSTVDATAPWGETVKLDLEDE